MSLLNRIGTILTLFAVILTPLLPVTVAAESARGETLAIDASGPLLRLRVGTFNPTQNPPDIPTPLRRSLAFTEPGLYIIQFAGPVQDEDYQALVDADLEIITYLPDYGYLLWGDHLAVARATTAAPIRWSDVYHPFYALHPALAESESLPPEVEVTIQVYDGPSADGTLKTILNEAKVTAPPRSVLKYQNLGVRIASDRLAWLASLPHVVNVEPRQAYQRLDELQGQIMAGALNTAGTQPSGPGYLAWLQNLGFSTNPLDYPIVDVIDDGFDNGNAADPAHPDFRELGNAANDSRVIWAEDYTGDGPEGTDGHGNINVSIVGGYNDQTGFPYEDDDGYNYGLGINPFGRMASRRVFDDSGSWDTGGTSDTQIAQESYQAGARITSNSWGAGTGGDYTSYDQEWDAITRDADGTQPGNQELINVFAAGNSGSSSNTTGSPGNAKNVITVGAAENYRPDWTDGCGAGPTDADSAQDIASFSSRGPTDDDRIKPDIVAPGTHIQGAASQDPSYTGYGVCDQYHPSGQTLYAASSGTSHSTPAAAGAASLVYYHYMETFGGLPPSPAMTKAYLINAGRYLEGVDGSGDLPTPHQGYGEVHLGRAFDDVSRVVVDQTELFDATGQSYTLEGFVATSEQPFRVSLAWTDAPGATTGASYVNDLDLEVTVGGETYKGNVFSGATSVTGGSADPRNNVESVFLPSGVSGPFSVEVKATNIAGDGVPGNGDATDQDFALIIYNAAQEVGYIDGTVYDGTAGAPLAGAALQAITGTVTYEATTSSSGVYSLTVAPDTYTLSAWKYGYTQESQSGVIVSQDLTTTVPLTLTQTTLHTLDGCITDAATGDPLWATLTILGPFGDPITETLTSQTTGCYALSIYGGPYTVEASALLHDTDSVQIDLTGDATQDFALTATTTDGLLLGEVTNLETGAPIEGASVSATPGMTTTETSTDGTYALQLPVGTYTITVSAPLYETAVEPGVTIPQSNFAYRNYALGTSELYLLPSEGLHVSLEMGDVATRTLTISNTGSGELAFEFLELFPDFTPGVTPWSAGGPDPFGYTYADSDDPQGPLYEWIDATDGASASLSDDGEINITLPFSFDFYGTLSTDLRIGNNGALLFNATSGDVSYSNAALSSATTDDLIAPFWDDLDSETGAIYYQTVGTAPNRHFVIEWHDRPHYNGVGAATFEIILYEETNNIKFQYQDLDFGNASYDYGASATVGIRGSGDNHLQYSYNEALLEDGLAICFQYPGSPPCDARDIAWLATEPVSGTVASGDILPVTVTFDAGTANQPGDYTAFLRTYSNAPDAQPFVDYPVTMTVQSASDWGKIVGTVTGDRPGGPLEDALVEFYIGLTPVYSTTTAVDGSYSTWLSEGLYDVAINADGYVEDRQPISIAAGVTTTHDVELRLAAPKIAVSPPALVSAQYIGQIISHTLSISNTGGDDLSFKILEIPPDLPTAQMSLATLPSAATGEVEISPTLLQELEEKGQADFWIEFAPQADLSPAYHMPWEARGRFVYDTLRDFAARTQAETRAYLDERGMDYTAHWMVNAIFVRGGSMKTVERVRQIEGIQRIREPRILRVPEPIERQQPFFAFTAEPTAAEWGLTMIQAPEAWAAYTRGEGIVVANIDTGVRYTHEALVDHYRGNLGGSFDHDFNWYDPQGNATPSDDHGHGSHTMGTMVGDDGVSNQIGVAPGATWIAADGCDGTGCPDPDLLSSAEWMLAPCPIGVEPGDPQCDPDLRPHVINNSWGDCETTTTDFYETQIDAWRAAGIFTAFSNGNTGNCGYASAFCNSMGNPARHYQVTSVGATDSSDNIASFSLWGPTDDPDPRLTEYANIKPEVSAPGQAIRSSVNGSDSSYSSWSGTSMAAPHVSGLAALIFSMNPTLIGQNDLTEDIMKQTADPKAFATGCGNEGAGNVPNNAFGWGRINALQAVEESARLADIPWVNVMPPEDTTTPGGVTPVTVGFDATGLEPGTYTATLRIIHDDPYTETITIPLSMTVRTEPPSLSLAKSASHSQVEVGTTLVYTLTVDNNGGPATGIVITDTLPAHTQFAWAEDGGRLEGGAVVWEDLALHAMDTLAVTYGVTVSCVTSGTQIVNDLYQVTAREWLTPTWGLPVTVTAQAEGITADFTFPSPALVDHPLAFTSLTTNATGFVWAFGDGHGATQRHPQHAYATVGTFTATLTATNACNSAVASHSVTVETYDLALTTSSPQQMCDPGQALTFTAQITNTGTMSDTFELTILNDEWTTQLHTDSVFLDVGDTATVSLTITIPADAEGGASDTFTLRARASSDPRTSPATADLDLEAMAAACYDLHLNADTNTQSVAPGDTAHYTLEVVNASNVMATITLTRTNAGWPTTITPSSLDVAAAGRREIDVAVTVPVEIGLNTTDIATIRATAGDVYREVDLTTQAYHTAYLPLVMKTAKD